MKTIIKIGQVWRNKETKYIGDKIAIVAISPNKVFISGYLDQVDPEITIEYLLKNYYCDNDYSNTDLYIVI